MANGNTATIAQMQSTIGSADWSNWTQNRWTFYDYVRYPSAGTNQIQLFVQPNGSVDTYASTVNKTLEQTNMSESRSFGRVGFIIQQIRTHIRVLPKTRQPTGINNQASVIVNQMTGLMTVLADLVHMGVLKINIGQKEYWDVPQPFITCPPGFGPHILQHAADTGSATQAEWFQQDFCPDGIYNVTPPQMIEAGQTFSCNINFDNANSPALTNLVNGTTPLVEIGVLFDGYILRPMQ